MKSTNIPQIIQTIILTIILLFSPIFISQTQANLKTEIKKLRTETSKTYQTTNSNNKASYEKVNYSERIHYWNGSEWIDIDNNLIKISSNIYINKANDFEVIIPKDLKEGIKYKKDEEFCEIKLESIDEENYINTVLKISENKASYYLSDNLNLEFTIFANGVRTEIVVKDKFNSPKEIIFDVTNCNAEIFNEAIMFDEDSQSNVGQIFLEKENQKLLILKPDYESLDELKGEIRIDPSITSEVTKDTFVSTTTPYGNGSRRFLAIGNYYDSTVDAYFPESKTLIGFSNINIPKQAEIESTILEIYHYGTNIGDNEFYVSTINGNWEENESWPGPQTIGNYGVLIFPYYNSNQIAQKRLITLDNDIVKNLDQGVSIQSVEENSSGVVICSKEIPSGPCLDGMEPKLITTYSLGTIPQIPLIEAPDDNWELGPNENYDNVICSQTGKGLGCDIGFQIYAEDEDESMPLSTIIQISNNKGEILEFEHVQETSGWFTKYIQITDGEWTWKAKTVNQYGNESDWSGERHFLIDTTSPTTPIIQEEPIFTKGKVNTIYSNKSTDNSIIIKYYFEVSLQEEFSTIIENSSWTSRNYYRFSSLNNEELYYYRAKSIDKYGNESSYSNATSSTQDSRSPSFYGYNLSTNIISPQNQDGNLDYAIYTAETRDLHWDKTFIRLYNSQREKIFEDQIYDQNFSYQIKGKDYEDNWLPDGIYTIQLIAHDIAGNITSVGGTSTQNDNFKLIIDNSAGVLNISYPENESWFSQDEITITGITSLNSSVTIKNQGNNIEYSPLPDEELGVFEQNIILTEGENSFNIQSTDSYNNIITKDLIIYKETLSPQIKIHTPLSTTNNKKPLIQISLNDEGYLSSGINLDQINLSLIKQDEEIVLINNGLLISDLGYFESNCSQSSECFIKYNFDKELQPDGNYTILANISDIAGNKSIKEKEFKLDSQTYLEIISPNENEIFNHSEIKIEGIAEINSQIKIWNNEKEIYGFQVTEDNFVIINNCRTENNLQLCNFTIPQFELEKDVNINSNIINKIVLKSTDYANNIETKEINVYTNLFSISLSIDTDLNYFSPNNDGMQDGVNFINLKTDGLIDNWDLIIKDENLNIIKKFSGTENLPENIYWNGTDDNGDIIKDGNYNYSLQITTTDEIKVKTETKELYARTKSEGEIYITSPQNNNVVTKGVTNIYGIAPAKSQIKICNDVVGLDGICNSEYYTQTNELGMFSLILPLIRLPDNQETTNIISAQIIDKYGNESKISNYVNIIVDTIDPFVSISALPIITGINQEDDYQEFLEKVDNKTVTKEDIDNLKTVIFRSTISKNTEWVNFKFADFTNLSELPKNYNYQYLGYINNQNQSYWFEDTSELDYKCEQNECTWDFYYPVPPVIGGIYEIVFTGKKAEKIESLSAAITIDGTLPLTPTILDINKIVEEETFDLTLFNNNYYSNNEKIEIVGISDPQMEITILDQNNTICTTKTNNLGLFYCQKDLSELYEEENFEVNLKIKASNNLNITESVETVNLIIDKEPPNITINSITPYITTSDSSVEFNLDSNEILNLAEINLTDYVEILTLSTDKTKIIDNLYIEPNESEGLLTKEIDCYDLAGNKSTSIIEVQIDNTPPDSSEIIIDNWGDSGINYNYKYPATNRLGDGFITSNNLTLTGFAEENSSVLIFVNGDLIQEVKTDSDVKNNNMYLWNYETNLSKEGTYVFSTKVKDKAGNLSQISDSVSITLDQTEPQIIDILNLEDNTYEDEISFDIETERFADVKIKIINSENNIIYENIYQNTATGLKNITVEIGNISGIYTISVKVYDSAGNIGRIEKKFEKLQIPIIPQSINEQIFPLNNTGEVLGVFEEQLARQDQENSNTVKGASLEDPWAGQVGSSFSNAWLNVNVKYDGTYSISNYSVPSPILTMIDVESNTGNIYGVATPKNQELSVNYNFYYASFHEAKELCGIPSWKTIGLIWDEEKDCVEKNMGINNLRTWYAKQNVKCSFLPTMSLFCINNNLKNWRKEDFNSKTINAEHISISFYKNEKEYIGNIWNDSSDGKFKKDINIPNDVSEGDKIKAKTSIFGDFEINGIKIDYRLQDSKGLQSGLSSALTVGGARVIPNFIEPINVDEVCEGTHNENKQYSVAESAIFLSSLLEQRSTGKQYYSKFKCADPFCAHIPQKVQETYTLAGGVWNPNYSPNTYVQCIAFVYMAYNLAGNPINKVSGHAITMAGKQWNCTQYDNDGNCSNWVLGNNSVYLDQFNVYKSGETDVMPEVGDIMVWEQSPPYGHVGVVTGIVGEYISIANANSNKTIHTFELENINEKIYIKAPNTSSWKPNYWVRKNNRHFKLNHESLRQ